MFVSLSNVFAHDEYQIKINNKKRDKINEINIKKPKSGKMNNKYFDVS